HRPATPRHLRSSPTRRSSDLHKLLNAQYTETLTTGKVDTPGGGRYAFGFDDRTTNGIRCFGHGGGAPGMNGELEICPTARYVVRSEEHTSELQSHVDLGGPLL